MKLYLTLLAVVTAVALLGGALEPALAGDEAPETVREAIAAWNDTLEDAFARGDAEAIAGMFTEDAVIVEPLRPPVRGRQAIRDYFQYFMEFGLEDLRSVTEEVFGDDETAIEIGRNVVYLRGGTRSTSRFMCLYRHVDGRWLVHRVVGTS